MDKSVKSSRLRSLMLVIVTLGVIGAFAYYLYFNADKYSELLRVSASQVAALLGLSLLFPVVSGVMNTYLFRSMGAPISHKDGFLLTVVSTLANQLPISGGIVSKGFYLKRKYGISYTKSFTTTFALFFCFIATNGAVGMMILLYWIFLKGIIIPPVLLIGFAAMISCFFVFWMPVDRIRMPEKIHKWVHEAVQGWEVISKSPALLLKLMGLQVVLLFLSAIRYWLAFRMLSQEIRLDEVLLLATASILTQLVGFAPGGLGVRELIVGTIVSLLGGDMGASMVAVGLDRLISMLPIFIVGGAGMAILGTKISEPIPDESLEL